MLETGACQNSYAPDNPAQIHVNPREGSKQAPMTTPESTLTVRPLIAATVFGTLPGEALDALCAVAAVQRYKVATLLWPAGQPMQNLWLVVRGQIDIYDRQTDGLEGLVGVVGPGRWVSWVGLFMEQPHQQDFWAAEDTVLIAVPAAAVRQVAVRHPALYPRLIDEIGNRMQIFMQLVGQAVVGTPAQRLAGLLHGLAQVQAADAAAPQLDVSQARLAQMLGMSRQLVGKSLEALEQQGLLRRAYGKIELGDLGALAAFVHRPRDE